jgi:orotate phosphoribosyltransferase
LSEPMSDNRKEPVLATSDASPCEFCQAPAGHGDQRDWHMPLTFSAEFVHRLGNGIWAQIPDERPAHLVVVASGGVGMGVAGAATASAGRLRSVTVVKRAFDFDSPQLDPAPEDVVVILDNSLHTGRSVAKVIDQLNARNIKADCVITIFDGAHDCETEARQRLEQTTGVAVRSCASWADRHNWV